ncbi:acetyl/propionyl/methylcrotonyl-CoA carboxylase subunit alpha [Verrucomicrobium sp. 3C]|uniref:acetyl-CoA carboxylase biotin carboxylase subunit n=1 Tax=Verrucomicrobium sp. 3C TaxID=1134055 RepID=UPI0005934331|nr:acetyl-CoA carboxylase biotin carboxylase subunit [Verrucomicrobium sp. 3C]
MFSKVLVANRGEIAVRVIRACRELGVRVLAVYSDADRDSLAVRMADEAICIGSGSASSSYLRADRIISAAEIGDVDAIHPGYGFLAENANFAEICSSCNIKFIGPSASAIAKVGDKVQARFHAQKLGVPVPAGSEGIVENEQEALKAARRIGFPVVLKAVAGGGGKGMRVAHNDVSLVQGFHAARIEAEKSFGEGDLYVEKLIESPHHVEIQIVGDQRGRIIHLGERDCSIQRKNQKLLEESPSPILDVGLRKKMGRAAVRLGESIHYESVGTVEFLVDGSGAFYFIEMNPRIQVEHAVTEQAYGIDLVKEQIKIAAGYPLDKTWDSRAVVQHAVEMRINAEDVWKEFRPSPGRVEALQFPGGPGIRVDSHLVLGTTIPPYYDSLLAKIIASGQTREDALARLGRALDELVLEGVKTTVPIGKAILQDPDFRRGNYSTGFLPRLLASKGALTD